MTTHSGCDFSPIEIKEFKEILLKTIPILPERYQHIIALRFGFKDGICYTLKEIGKKMGVTGSRIQCIEKVSLRRIQIKILRIYREC